ncbi:hypothetical protein UCREL1_10935 [Eutypa lata UCREL1]|uniref:Uncharacterized protein n=1 Tax=Eutypa lata (strain UCR-EL1) TaxID=1287681 RepID=M7T676_EUTLA|nr:hypothetical protein UCREL1_10935 [Eutypa lata UCREL1]
MSTGGSGADSGRLFNYGTSTAGPNVDLTDDQARGTNAGFRETGKESKTSGIMNSLKEALKPGDTRHSGTGTGAGTGPMGDTTHDGRHGGIIETMKPGHQDYDVREEHQRNNKSGIGQGVVDTVKQALGRNAHDDESHRDATGANSGVAGSSDLSHTGTMADPGHVGSALESGSGATDYGASPSGAKQNRLGARTSENYDYDKQFASTGSPKGAFGRGSELGDRAVPRVSAFDSQGSVGHQFTTEGPIGSMGQKVGGPLSKEGAIGKQFTDSGAVGGTVQDTLGHGNATRKGN